MNEKICEYKISPKLILLDQAEKFLKGVAIGWGVGCSVFILIALARESIAARKK